MENDRFQRMLKKGKGRFNKLLIQSGCTASIAQASKRPKVDISRIEEMIKQALRLNIWCTAMVDSITIPVSDRFLYAEAGEYFRGGR